MKHIAEKDDLFERLDNAGMDLSELLRIIMMLRSLSPCFHSFVTALENRPQEDLPIGLVLARLRDEWQKWESQSGKAEKAPNAAVKPRSETRKCFFCDTPGHLEEEL